jgi:hypothetical protein
MQNCNTIAQEGEKKRERETQTVFLISCLQNVNILARLPGSGSFMATKQTKNLRELSQS